jgi:rubrerythrin
MPTPLVPRYCKCGCGRRVQGQRRWHQECASAHAESRRLSTAERDKRRALSGERHTVVSPSTEAVRTRVPVCKRCCNLPHARPDSGCPACGLPRGELDYRTEKRAASALADASVWSPW